MGDRLQVTAPTRVETGVVKVLSPGYISLLTTTTGESSFRTASWRAGIIYLMAINPRVSAVIPIGIGYPFDIDKAGRSSGSWLRATQMERAESSPGRGNSAVVFSLRAGCPDAEASRLLESYLCEHAN